MEPHWLLVIRITQLLFIRHVSVIRKKTMEAGLGRRAAAAPVAGTGACGGARPRALGLKRLARRRSSRTKEIGASARSAESRLHTPAPDPRHHPITQTCRLIAELATLSMWRASDGKRPKPMKGNRPPKFLVKRHLLDHPVQTLCTLASARARPREPGQRKITLSTCPPYAYLTPCVPLSMLVPAAPRGSIGPRVLSGHRCAREPRHGTGKSAFSARGKIADSRCEQ